MSRSRDLADLSRYSSTISDIVTKDSGLKAGTIAFFGMTTAPAGWIKANGAIISRITYSDLFSAISTTYGAGNGTTTFALPDLRGEFPRFWDDSRGVDTSRGIGSSQTGATRLLMNGSSTGNNPEGNSTTGIITHKPGVEMIGIEATFWGSYTNRVTLRNAMDTTWGGASETRPRNIALLACIKY